MKKIELNEFVSFDTVNIEVENKETKEMELKSFVAVAFLGNIVTTTVKGIERKVKKRFKGTMEKENAKELYNALEGDYTNFKEMVFEIEDEDYTSVKGEGVDKKTGETYKFDFIKIKFNKLNTELSNAGLINYVPRVFVRETKMKPVE